jgi:hypothetical protein
MFEIRAGRVPTSMTIDSTLSWTAPGRTARTCMLAAEAAVRCASECLSSPEREHTSDCSESCLITARTLGAFADLIERATGPRLEIAIALTNAALVAARDSERAAGLHADIPVCADAADACARAARELDELLSDLEREHSAAQLSRN